MNDMSGEIIIGVWTAVASILFIIGVIRTISIDREEAKSGCIQLLISIIMGIPATIHYVLMEVL